MGWKVSGGSGGGSVSVSLLAEIEQQILLGYVKAVLVYTAGILTGINYQTSGSANVYTKALTYTSGILTSWLITKISDSSTLTCTLTYTSGILTQKDYS